MSSYPSEIDTIAAAVVTAMRFGSPDASSGTLTPESLPALRDALDRRLRERYPGTSMVDREEAIDEALLDFLAAAHGGSVDAEKSPGGYLVVATQRKLLSRLRRARSAPLSDELLATIADDSELVLARIVSEHAGASAPDDEARELVADAMRRARLARRYAVIRVVTAWLDIAERTGRTPTSAEVAERAGGTPAAARKGMERFREYLARAIADRA
jgi:hypothetical protein